MASDATTRRRGIAVNLAFVFGVTGAVLVLVGSTMPQLRMPGLVAPPLFEPGAPGLDAGTMVAVFALFAIAFCLSRRYRWLMLCAIMIVVFLTAALTYQLTGMLGLTIRQIVGIYNGVLPSGIDSEAFEAKFSVLQNTTLNTGLFLVAGGLLLMQIAPWVRRVAFRLGGGTKREPREPKSRPAERAAPRRWGLRREPQALAEPGHAESEASVRTALARPAAAAPAALHAGDLLLDDLYLFAEGLDQPLTFSLLDPSGRVTRHRMRMLAAGYLGDTYYLRCRDVDAGNLRDVPAHMMSDIVDDVSGQRIETDDMLQDLARVAYEAVAGDDNEPAAAPQGSDSPDFRVEIGSSAENGPRGSG